ncbi:hypothetical protein [Micromonospora echinospora]|uniref:hypothetical protein n=1 Tax=Micromonospora echinospora TaxID=1877 RepID=UPI003A88C261
MTTTTNGETTMSSAGVGVAADLAADFEKRRAGRVDAGDLVGENLAALDAAGVIAAADGDGAHRRQVLRTVAGGCGATAFALGAALAAGRAEAVLHHAAVQFGLAARAYAVAVERVRQLGDLARQPGPQFAVARMRGSLDTMTALLDRQAGRAVGDDAAALAEACTAGLFVAGEAEAVVSAAYDLVDADAAARIGQIWHDLKATPPPVPGALARELVGKAAFGIDPAATPRWV